MDLHSGKPNGEPTQNAAHFGFDQTHQGCVDGDRLVTIDLNLHLVPPKQNGAWMNSNSDGRVSLANTPIQVRPH
jgi:hypothetical protein